MSEKQLIQIYNEGDEWVQNLGESTIHAKRMSGRFRLVKWLSTLIWLPFFVLPYISWNGTQSILFNIDERTFYIFGITILPQDIWLLAITLLFLAILLAFMTTILGRMFCGYLCFQTVWTDVFTKLEELFEGTPIQQRKRNATGWNIEKILRKSGKHLSWLMIGIVSGVTWMLYFGVEWSDFFTGAASITTWTIAIGISMGAYIFAGFMREQTCLWLCPYARIQGTMIDKQTLLPTYDYTRGEPRAKLSKTQERNGGDCIDCYQCLAVCPTGVDIRKGQEYGCITCGLCIDACDSIMTKIGKPTGLIRYMSYNELEHIQTNTAIYKRPRVLVYASILILAFVMLIEGLVSITPFDVQVRHGRSPLFVQLSDGSIRNKYELKILNKTTTPKTINIDIRSAITPLQVKGELNDITINPTSSISQIIFISAFQEHIDEDTTIYFNVSDGETTTTYQSTFFK